MASISRFGVLSNVPTRSKAGLSFRIPRVTTCASFLLSIQCKGNDTDQSEPNDYGACQPTDNYYCSGPASHFNAFEDLFRSGVPVS